MMDSSQRRRVVITGMGVIAPNGLNLDTFWKNIRDGNSAADKMTRFDPGDAPTLIACEINDLDGGNYIEPKTARRLERSHLYAVCAAKLAAQDANIDCAKIDAYRVGVVEGTSVSSHEGISKADTGYMARGYRSVGMFSMRNSYAGAGASEIAHELHIMGHCITCSSSSASGNDAIGYALHMIQDEEVDVMIAGGTEAPILPHAWGPLCVNKVLSRHNDNPKAAMRPFDKSRDGLVLGEGAAFLVMEELSFALARGARIYCEVLGHGRSCEAYHPVAPHPEGIGYFRSMEKALRRAQVDISEIDYINAHGTATDANDVVETKAIRNMFGHHARRIAVSSTKPVTGHLMAAAGALETVVTALAIQNSVIPLTLNHHDPDPECDLDYVKDQSRPYPIRIALNLSAGFGGKNSCLVLRRFPV